MVPGLVARPAFAQSGAEAMTDRIRADLAQHAAFGDKFSGGPGDLATARWIAGRLRKSGYRVEESEFQAPFFVKRAARLTSGTASVDLVPQAPVVPTGPAGVTAQLALVEGGAIGDVKNRLAIVVLPFGRHAALFPDRGIGQTVKQVAAAGARAIVMVTTGPSGEAVALNSPRNRLYRFRLPSSRRGAPGRCSTPLDRDLRPRSCWTARPLTVPVSTSSPGSSVANAGSRFRLPAQGGLDASASAERARPRSSS
jgi:hypothetical protein